MTNKTKGVDYSKVTPELLTLTREVIAEGRKHRYSVSKVYTAHNAAFGLNETPSTCSSCLINRVRNLSQWLDGYTAQSTTPEPAPAEVEEPAATTPEPAPTATTVAPKQRKARTPVPPSTDEELM